MKPLVRYWRKKSADVALQVPLPDNLTVTEREKFLAFLSHYSNALAVNNDDLGCITVLNHEINTNGAPSDSPAG